MPRCKNVIYGATGTMSFIYIRMGCRMRDTALWLEVSGDVFLLLEVAQQNMALFIHTCLSSPKCCFCVRGSRKQLYVVVLLLL